MRNFLILLPFIILFTLVSCKTKSITTQSDSSQKIDFGAKTSVIFLDSAQAAMAIVQDKTDGFFDRVTMTEMEIQMRTDKQYSDRDACLKDYIAFMKTDVEDFTEEELSKVSEVFNNVKNLLFAVNPNLLNKDIILIKTKGNHYGDGVYYTRENKIVIPQSELTAFKKEQFTQTMLHEFSHVFNRYNKDVRDQLYALIGFEEARGPIILPETINGRKLLNPDGTTDYYIKLTNIEGEEVLAYPLISATEDHYVKSKPTFFSYLDFHMYELTPMEDNVYKLVLSDEGATTIPFERIPSFFTKIKDNTNYIIHPDEIIADNFIYTILYFAENKKVKNFSEEGMRLIETIGGILKAYERRF